MEPADVLFVILLLGAPIGAFWIFRRPRVPIEKRLAKEREKEAKNPNSIRFFEFIGLLLALLATIGVPLLFIGIVAAICIFLWSIHPILGVIAALMLFA